MKLDRAQSGEPLVRGRRTVVNGAYSVADYVSQPLGLLVAAPYLLRHMGATEFGIWVLASAVVNGGNALSTGFGDAAIKYVAMYRGQGDALGIARIVRAMLSINLLLSTVIAGSLWLIAPFAAGHISHIDVNAAGTCRRALRIGSALLVVRAIDSVFASTSRAFEQYGPTVRISICFRVSTLLGVLLLVASGRGVVEIMLATLCMAALAAAAQAWVARRAAGSDIFLPSLHRETLRMIGGFGGFSWLQALSSVIFGQADRLVIGVFLGAPSVAAYAFCDQAAQCIHGTVAAGFQVLFPHLGARLENESITDVRQTLWMAFKVNAALTVLLSAPVILLGRPILTLWMGHDFAQGQWRLFSVLSVGSALLAMNVTAYYGLLAAGRIRLVMSVNLAAGTMMLVLMSVLTPHFGTLGTACGWLIAGPVTCLLYVPLYRTVRAKPLAFASGSTSALVEDSL